MIKWLIPWGLHVILLWLLLYIHFKWYLLVFLSQFLIKLNSMLVKKDYLPLHLLLCLAQCLIHRRCSANWTDLESTRMVILTGQFLFNLWNFQQIPLTDQPRQFSNHCHMLWYSPRHLLELWIILNKGLHGKYISGKLCYFLTEDRHVWRRHFKKQELFFCPD